MHRTPEQAWLMRDFIERLKKIFLKLEADSEKDIKKGILAEGLSIVSVGKQLWSISYTLIFIAWYYYTLYIMIARRACQIY